MNIRTLLMATFAAAGLATFAPAANATPSVCPAVGQATAGCDLVITFSASGTTITAGPSYTIHGGTYDGSDDTLVGVVNNTTATINHFTLSSTVDIFGFDSDGIDTFGVSKSAANSDTTGYGGPLVSFSGINAAATAGTVNIAGGLAPGASTYFSLEEALSLTSIRVSPVPEPASFAVLGFGLLGAGLASRLRRGRATTNA